MLKNSKISGFADEINEDITVQVKLLKKLGISHIELRSANGKNISDFTPEEAKELKDYLSDNQMVDEKTLGINFLVYLLLQNLPESVHHNPPEHLTHKSILFSRSHNTIQLCDR